MSAWEQGRDNASFEFIRCLWPSLEELSEYGMFTGGSIERNALSPIKHTCSLDWVGDAPDTVDAVRVYYGFDGSDGESYRQCLGTFLITYDGATATEGDDGLIAHGTANGRSVLSVMDDRILGAPYTVPAGSNPLDTAIHFAAETCGLSVFSDNATYSLRTPHTFEEGTSYIDAVNWCLSAIGFASADSDMYGNVLFKRYQEPSYMNPAWVFESGSASILGMSIEKRNDYMESPNVVRVCHSSDKVCIKAYAKAMSGCRSALSERGNREKTLFESVMELEGDTSTDAGRAAMAASLKALAIRRLLDNCGEIEKASFTHPYVPINCGVPVRVSAQGTVLDMSVTSMRISLTPSAQCATEGRRFVTDSVTVSSNAEVVWHE